MSFNKDNKVNNGYSSISIGLASPEEILAQSSGEVLNRGEHVFTQRLGYGIPVLLDIDGRLSPGDENLCHETFF